MKHIDLCNLWWIHKLNVGTKKRWCVAVNSSSTRDNRQEFRKNILSQLQKKKKPLDKTFYGIVLVGAGYTLFILALVVYTVGNGSIEIFSHEGLEFFTSTDWNAVYGRDAFGALPYIVGTIVTSTIAMMIGVPVSIGIAVFLSDIAPRRLSTPLSFVIELLGSSSKYCLWTLGTFHF